MTASPEDPVLTFLRSVQPNTRFQVLFRVNHAFNIYRLVLHEHLEEVRAAA
jgi:hypothetical protein